MKLLLTAISSVAMPGWAMFVQKEPQGVRSALLETSSELREMIQGFTVDPTGDLLGTVASMITDTMMPGILSSHNSTQQQLVAFGQAFSTCPSPTIAASTQAAFGECKFVPVFIKSHRGEYLEDRDGAAGVRADDGDWQKWSIFPDERGDNTVFIKSHRGEYLEDRDGTVGVRADAGDWQRWTISPTEEGGDTVFIKSHRGEYLEDRDGTVGVRADAGDWQKWKVTTATGNLDCLFAKGSTQCGWKCYLSRYKDLKKAFGTNQGAAQNHYKQYGMKEKRDCTCGDIGKCNWGCYLGRYADLRKAFGTNQGAAENHYREYGIGEKRDCTCDSQGAAMLVQRESSRSMLVQSTTISTTVLGDAQWIAATMGTLAQCRQREGAADTEHKKCLQDLSVFEGVKNSTCNSLKALKTTPVDEFLCAPTDPYDQWLITAKGKMTALKEGLSEKTAGCGNATTMFNDKAPMCDALKLQLDGNKTACDQLQGQTEAGMCSGPLALQRGQCEDYSKCYNAALAAYQDEKPTIEAMHLNWTVQWRTLKRMDCLLGIMQAGGTNDDIDKCKEKTWPTDHLDLDYPLIPDKEECPGAAGGAGTTLLQISQTTGAIPLPCEADFVTKYYGSNPLGAPAATCTPCSPLDGTDGTTATTTPAAVSSSTFGGDGGGFFTENKKAEGKVISRMCIFSGSMIDAVQLYYWSGEKSGFDAGGRHGGGGGGEKCLILERHEQITKVVVLAGSAVDGIEATTSKGRVEKWGGSGGGRNDFEMAGMHLIGISGRKGSELDAFGVIFGA